MKDAMFANRQLGKVLTDKYKISNLIAHGGYSSVFRCIDKSERSYACKMMPKTHMTKERYDKELKIMKRIYPGSAKMIECYDNGETEDAYYIIQEFCMGGNLFDYASTFQYACLSEKHTSGIIREVLLGLTHMHSRNVIHGDIKPGNVLLGLCPQDLDMDNNNVHEHVFYESIKICDVGNSILMDEHVNTCIVSPPTIENEIKSEKCYIVDILRGTPCFMSPELLSHQNHTKTDIWSLGVMTFLLLCGRVPFDDREKSSTNQPRLPRLWKSILNDKPDMTTSVWKNVSKDGKDFVELCLKKSFVDRPSAEECLNHPWIYDADKSNVFKLPFKLEYGKTFNYTSHRLGICSMESI